MSTIIILLIIVAVLALWVVAIFNGLVVLKNRAKEAWADIDVQLKRRYDLIPNLVETVKGYATHERELFEKVTQARANAMSADGVQAKGDAENMLSSTLKSLFAVSENYPDLKANANFLDLQRELADTENKMQASRRFFNSVVMELNNKVQTFPANLVANKLGFNMEKFFEVSSQAEKEVVKVKF